MSSTTHTEIKVDIIPDPRFPCETSEEYRYPCRSPQCQITDEVCDEDGYCILCGKHYDTNWCVSCGDIYSKGGDTRCAECIDWDKRCPACEEYPYLCRCA